MTLDGNALKLKTFCTSALSMLGVNVAEDVPDLLSVSVPVSRLDLFDGRDFLRLAFSSDRLGPEIEFVVPGSYILERILEAVRARGDVSESHLPASVQASPSPGIKIENADCRLVSSRILYYAILEANYRVSIVTDENEDRLCRVLVDLATGKQLHLDLSTLTPAIPGRPSEHERAEIDFVGAFRAARGFAEDFARGWVEDAQADANGRLSAELGRLDEYYEELLADRARGKGQDVRKLHKLRDRAATTYSQRAREFDVAAGLLEHASNTAELNLISDERWQALDQERNRGLTRRFFLDYDNYSRERARIDAEIKDLRRGQEIARLVIRDSTDDTRTAVFERLRQESLGQLRGDLEQKEAERFGESHTADLDGIRDELDKEKARRVDELRDKFQVKVVITPISTALLYYPRMESTFAAVSGTTSVAFATAHDLVFDRIEVPACDRCGAVLSAAYVCTCGRLVCSSCRRTCTTCGKVLCTGCASGVCQLCGGVLCSDHIGTCSECDRKICPAHSSECSKCGKALCKSDSGASCARTCAICGSDFCHDHAVTCPDCGSTVCLDDTRKCDDCGVQACKVDVADCPSCGRAACPDHRSVCALCGQSVCGHCMTQSGLCWTCEGLFPATTSSSAIEQILAELAHLPAGGGRWLVAESDRQFVLVRQGMRMRVFVVDKSPCRLRVDRTLGLLDSARFGSLGKR